MDITNSSTNSKVVLMVDSFELKEAITQAVNEAMKSQEPEPEVYITHKEAEKRLGVCRATLWNWHNTGYLRKYYRGKKVIYRLSDVDRIIRGEL